MTTSDELVQALAADLVAMTARAEVAEAALEAMRQITDEDAHWLAELVWSELYGVRRWNMDECATGMNDIMHEIMAGYIERKDAAYIERQAARIASLTAIPEDVEGLCRRLAHRTNWIGTEPDPDCVAAAAALRAYAALTAFLAARGK